MLLRGLRWVAEQVFLSWFPWSCLALITTVVVAVWWRRRLREARERALVTSTWLEITPPARMPAEGVAALPRGLIGVLSRLGGSGVRRRLALEVYTDGQRSRLGVWVPGGVAADRVARVIRHALPGVRVDTVEPPFLAEPAVGLELRPRRGPGAPLIDPPSGRSVLRAATETGEEGLRGVFAALTGSGQRACMQLVLTITGGGHTDTAFGEIDWGSLARKGLLGLLNLLEAVVREAAKAVLELITPGPSSRPSGHARGYSTPAHRGYGGGYSGGSGGYGRYGGSGGYGAPPVEPWEAAYRREVAAKRAHRPRVHATLRVAVFDAPLEAGRSLAAEVADSYWVPMPRAELRAVRVGSARRFEKALALRCRGRGMWVTEAELGALWHLPAEPSRYNLPDAAARNRPGQPGVPRLPGMPGTSATRAQRSSSPSTRRYPSVRRYPGGSGYPRATGAGGPGTPRSGGGWYPLPADPRTRRRSGTPNASGSSRPWGWPDEHA